MTAPPALHVACATEGAGYVAHCATMLHSVLSQHPAGGVHVHYMHGPDLSARARRRLARMVERDGGAISFLPVPDERVAGLPTRGFTRKATWYRIFLPHLREGLDRILYLDADLLALQPLTALWDTPLEGHYVAAVTNVFPPWFSPRANPSSYFNAGVMLMNLDAMRRDECTGALFDYGVRHADDLEMRDQDALNAVLGAHRRPLHPRWNCMNAVLMFPAAVELFGAGMVDQARRDPAIRHFEGPADNKPWHLMCQRDLRELYRQHRRRTPWPRMRPEGVTPRNVARRARARARARLYR